MSAPAPKPDAARLRPLRLSLPMELLKAREAAMCRFRPMLRSFGLTEQQWRALRVLAEYERLDATELSRKTMLLGPSVTRILQFLEAEGLVRRLADKTDQRRAFLKLTAKGRRLFTAVAPASEAIYAEMEQSFGRDRMAELYHLLSDFHGCLESGGGK